MTSAQVVETSVIVNNNSSFQNYTNPDDHTQQTTDTPGFKSFTVKIHFVVNAILVSLALQLRFTTTLYFDDCKKTLLKNVSE